MERIAARMKPGGHEDCWETTYAKQPTGYAQVWIDGRPKLLHRVVYEAAVGVIPDGMVIDHLCRNRACCNPAHLEVVTNRENILRGEGLSAKNAKKTHCKHGHEFTEENTYAYRGKRYCRACQAAAKKRRQRERKLC